MHAWHATGGSENHVVSSYELGRESLVKLYLFAISLSHSLFSSTILRRTNSALSVSIFVGSSMVVRFLIVRSTFVRVVASFQVIFRESL